MDALVYGTTFVALSAISIVMKYAFMFGVDLISMRIRVACMALVFRKVGISYLGPKNRLDDQRKSCTGSEIEPRKHK